MHDKGSSIKDVRTWDGEGVWSNVDKNGQGEGVDFYCIFAYILYGWCRTNTVILPTIHYTYTVLTVFFSVKPRSASYSYDFSL